MILVVFAIVFTVVSALILIFAYKVLHVEREVTSNDSYYSTEFVKGAVRGALGMFESNSMLESKRTILKKSSKF